MIRKLTVILLSGVICLLGAASVLAYNQSPMLDAKVATGELPPVEERLPREPLVVEPLEEIGQYGGTMVGCTSGARDWGTLREMFRRESFVMNDSSGEPTIMDIARNYEFSEDGKSLTIYLRKGIRWSDGVPFTADDIMFAYNDIIMNEKLALQTGMSMQKQYFSPTAEPATIEKIDDYTVCFHFPELYPLVKYHLAYECGATSKILFPKHYLEKRHIKYNPKADELAKEKGLANWYELWPSMADVQTGEHNTTVDYPTLRAYVLKEKGPGYMIAERNPYYWKVDPEGNQLPYIDKLMVIQNLDPEVAVAKTLAGDFDWITVSIESLVLLKENEQKGNYRVLVWDHPNQGGMGAMINQTYNKDLVLREIFRDVRFRRALSLAINREEFNDINFYGLGHPAQATIARGNKYYEEEFAKSYAEYDPQQANTLLDEMGLDKRDKEGYRLRKDGKRLSILFEYADFTPASQIELIKEYWEAVGVEVTLKPQAAQLIFERFPANEVQVGSFGPGITGSTSELLTNPPWLLPRGWPGYSTIWPLWLKWTQTGGKEGEEPIEEVKRNLKRLSRMQITMDEEERTRLGKEILRSQAENLWVIGTVAYGAYIQIARKNLRNVPDDPMGLEAYPYPEAFFFKE